MEDSLVVKHITLPILSLVMISGNGLLIYVMLRTKSLRTVTNYFIVSLAVSDLLMGCPVLPLMVAAEEGFLGRSPRTCLVVFCLAITQVLVSCLVLISIAVERYIAIVRPLWHHTMLGTRNAGLIIALCWAYSLFVGCLPLFGWNAIQYSAPDAAAPATERSAGVERTGSYFNIGTPVDSRSNYSLQLTLTNTSRQLNFTDRSSKEIIHQFECRYHTVITGSFAAFMYPGHFVFLWVCLIILYGRIYLRSRNQTSSKTSSVRRLSAVSLRPVGVPLRRAKENWRALRIIAAIVGYFLFSWLGMVIWYGMWFQGFTIEHRPRTFRAEAGETEGRPTPLPMWFYSIAVTLAFSNSAVNPFIYGLGNRSVRRACVKLLCCNRMQRQPSPAQHVYYHGVSMRSATTAV